MYLNIAGFALLLLGFALVYFLTDTPSETLLKNSPFGKNTGLRFGGDGWLDNLLDKLGLGAQQSFVHWDQHRELAYHESLNFFFRPRVTFQKTWVMNNEFCELTIQTPALSVSGIYMIDLQAFNEEKQSWETMTLLSNDPNHRSAAANPDKVLVTADSMNHQIRIHRSLIRTFGMHHGTSYIPFLGAVNTAETSIRIRVKTFPNGEGKSIFPGTAVQYVLPAPTRDQQGNAVINEQLVDEQAATENCWYIVEDVVTHGAY